MGFLSNVLGGMLSGAGGNRDPYPHAIMMTSDKEVVANAFLKHLEEVLDTDRNYSKFLI